MLFRSFVNAVYKEEIFPKEYAKSFLKILSPVAPYMTEELWQMVFNKKESIAISSWPEFNESLTQENIINIAISVNGKLRATLEVEKDMNKDKLLKLAKQQANIIKHIEGKEIIKEIVVPNKIVNLVVK